MWEGYKEKQLNHKLTWWWWWWWWWWWRWRWRRQSESGRTGNDDNLDERTTDVSLENRTGRQLILVPMAAVISPFIGPTPISWLWNRMKRMNETWDRHQGWSLPEIEHGIVALKSPIWINKTFSPFPSGFGMNTTSEHLMMSAGHFRNLVGSPINLE